MAWRHLVAPLGILVSVGFFVAEAAAHPALVGKGSTSVVRCNASAHIAPQTAYSRQAPGYEIATVRITSGPGCSGMKFRLSLLDSDGHQLAEGTGYLTAQGSAAPNFTARRIPAEDLGNVAITLTAGRRTNYR